MKFGRKLRFLKDFNDKKRLHNENFTLFSTNCIGGVIYHNLKLRFLSPTINLWISPKDYIKLLKDPQKYFFDSDMHEIRIENIDYPVGRLNDIIVYGQHYDNFNELKYKWNERKKRINWDNIFVFMIERDGCTYQDLLDFDRLPYKNKVVFTQKKYKDIKSCMVLPNSYDEENKNVNNLLQYKSSFSILETIDEFDYVRFFNGEGRHLYKEKH